MKYRNSLRVRSVTFVAVIMILMGVVFGTLTFIAIHRGQSDKVALQMNIVADQEADQLNERMTRGSTAVETIHAFASELVGSATDMKDPVARDAVKDSINEAFMGMANDTDSVIAYYMTFDPELIHARDGIFYSKDAEGVLHSNAITDIAKYDSDDVEHIGWYTIPKNAKKPVWLEPYYNKNINRWLISYVIPFYKEGTLVAVIGVDFDFTAIVDEIDQIKFHKNGYAFLKNADGTVHYHKGFFDGDVHGDEVATIPEESRELYDSGQTTSKTVIYDYDGQKRVGVLARLENGMVFSLVDSYAEVYARRNMMLLVTVLIVALATVLSIIAIHLASKRVAGPVEQLTDAIARMENGNYDIELPAQRTDEIGILTAGMRMFADTLKAQKAFNESEIASRNRKLEAAIIEADNANQAKTTFLTNMSHDIRTPMNAILGLTALIRKHIDDKARISTYVDQITVAGNQLLSLINDVLEISRIESNKMEFEEELVDTDAVFHSIDTVIRNQANGKDLAIRMDNNLQHRSLYMDRTHIEEIIMNLISNSIKYTPEGGQIHVRFDELPGADAEHVVIRTTVKDNGIGMSEEYQKKLFQSFEREENSTVNQIPGTGLGLSIVKKLVDIMGGTINVDSVQGIGTSMIVEIPHRIGKALECAAPEESDATDVDFAGKRMLLAEDNEINALIAKELLSEYGIILERAHNGQECVDMFRAADTDYYDMILMDVQMPVMNGYEATRAIRHFDDPVKARIPIIAMTANAFREDRLAVMNAGMNAHIAKPLDITQVIATLRRSLIYKNYCIDTDELSEFKTKYNALGCACGYFIYRANQDEKVIFADAVTESIFGCETEEEFLQYVGSSFKKMVHPEDLNRVERMIAEQQASSGNSINSIGYRIIRKDGAIRQIRDVGYKTYNGREMLFYVYIADVTDLGEV